ncbi:MAG: hypothetical protein LBB18_02310 [Puniceicoccales bacterium]|jgi:hypothetical protein|nr:hypothetical protein [Puniceicoccales bacterium]
MAIALIIFVFCLILATGLYAYGAALALDDGACAGSPFSKFIRKYWWSLQVVRHGSTKAADRLASQKNTLRKINEHECTHGEKVAMFRKKRTSVAGASLDGGLRNFIDVDFSREKKS